MPRRVANETRSACLAATHAIHADIAFALFAVCTCGPKAKTGVVDRAVRRVWLSSARPIDGRIGCTSVASVGSTRASRTAATHATRIAGTAGATARRRLEFVATAPVQSKHQ